MNSKVNSRCETACCASIRSSQAGFSLIELMVASTIGLLIMAAVLTLFLNVSRTNDEMAKTNMLIENGRFAIQLLQNDIAHAGFWDTYIPDFDDLTLTTAPVDTFTSVPQPCLAFSSWSTTSHFNRRLGIAVQVHDSVPSGCSSAVTNWKTVPISWWFAMRKHVLLAQAGARRRSVVNSTFKHRAVRGRQPIS